MYLCMCRERERELLYFKGCAVTILPPMGGEEATDVSEGALVNDLRPSVGLLTAGLPQPLVFTPINIILVHFLTLSFTIV